VIRALRFLTGVPLALFYVTLGISDLAARRPARTGAIILAACLIIWSGFTAACGLSRQLRAVSAGPDRGGNGRGGRYGRLPAHCWLTSFPADRRPMAFTILALGGADRGMAGG